MTVIPEPTIAMTNYSFGLCPVEGFEIGQAGQYISFVNIQRFANAFKRMPLRRKGDRRDGAIGKHIRHTDVAVRLAGTCGVNLNRVAAGFGN